MWIKAGILILSVSVSSAFAAVPAAKPTRAKPAAAKVYKDPTPEFVNGAQELLRTLIGMGYTRFGKIDLQAMVQRIEAVDVHPTGWFERSQPVGDVAVTERSSAQWSRGADGEHIAVNSELWAQTPPLARPVLALHEYFGALGGVDDDNYEASSALWLLTQPETAQTLNASELGGLKTRIAAQASGGGITGVGGGGDYSGLYVKMLMLRSSVRDVARATTANSRRDEVNGLYGVLYEKNEVRWDHP
jgi:hypothetical protein